MEELNHNACYDEVDERNYPLSGIIGNTGVSLPPSKLLDDGEILNQYKPGYYYACVFFTGASCSNTINFYNGDKQRITGEKLSDLAIGDGLLDPEKGANLISSPKLLQEIGYISGYGNCETLQDIKVSIFNKIPVQTGSNQINRGETLRNNNVAVKGDSYGHSFHIVGYDDVNQWLICENSYSDKMYDKGRFYLRYSDLDLLFYSKFSFIDVPDPILSYKQRIMENIKLEGAKKAFENGFWNGLEGDKLATREEVVTMIERAYEKLLLELKK